MGVCLNNYRSISLLPALSKVAERAILRRLKEETSEPDFLPPEQFGFRGKHSTELQLLWIVGRYTKEINQYRTTRILTLDVERAFDRVWRDGLIYEMMEI
ncbi:hypothetical protein YQE_01017, partial [Dendroctonus ponderosae]